MNKKNEIRILPTAKEGVSMINNAVQALIKSLPLFNDPTAFVVAASSYYIGSTTTQWSKDITDFLQSSKATENIEKPLKKLSDTLRFLQQGSLSDDDLLKALKDLHILSFSKDIIKSEEVELYLLLDIVRKMQGEEILTILSAYKIGNKLYSEEKMRDIVVGYDSNTRNARAWCAMVTRACGYSNDDYVIGQQEHLEALGLISERELDIRISGRKTSEFPPAKCFRLTDSGVKLAEMILRGEELSK